MFKQAQLGLNVHLSSWWWQELTHRVLDLFGRHLRDFAQAQELAVEQRAAGAGAGPWSHLWRAYASLAPPHLAATNEALEVNYTRAVVDLLLHVLVPPPHLESRTGHFVVAELITCNVLLPFIGRLSDPDWLNGLIIQVCGGSDTPDGPPASGPPTEPPPPAPSDLREATPQDSTVQVRTEMKAPSLSPEFWNATEEEPGVACVRRCAGGSKSNLFFLEDDSEPGSPSLDRKQISTQEEAADAEDDHPEPEEGCPSPTEGSPPTLLVNSQPVESPQVVGEAAPSLDHLSVTDREGSSPLATPSRELLLSVEQSPLGSLGDPGDGSPLQSSSPVPSFSFDPLSSPDGPVIIQNLRITGTITAKEHRGTGSHPYTLYTIKVSLLLQHPPFFEGRRGHPHLLLTSSTRRRWAARTQAASRRAWTRRTPCCRPASPRRRWPITRSTGGIASSSTCRRGWRRDRS